MNHFLNQQMDTNKNQPACVLKKLLLIFFRGIKETYIVHTEKPAEILTYLALRKMIHFLFFKTKDITDRHYFISLVNKFQKYFILLCHLKEMKLKRQTKWSFKIKWLFLSYYVILNGNITILSFCRLSYENIFLLLVSGTF